MKAIERYATAVLAALKVADAQGEALSYYGMIAETALSYGQVAAGLHYIRINGLLVNGKPLTRFMSGRQGFYCGAESRDAAGAWVNRQAKYGTTLFETLGSVVESIISVYGSDPSWRRLLLDVTRVREDAAFIQPVPTAAPTVKVPTP